MAVVKRSPSRPPTRSAARAHAVPDRVIVENINHPGSGRQVDAAKYRAMRRAILRVLPSRAPGLTLADALTAVLAQLPPALFPEGAHADWWFKTVQLDLEAKRVIAREKTSPLRVHQL
jgi:hypothetical protein